MTLSHSSIFTESRSRSTASISLQSSPNHSLTKFVASAQSLRPHSLSLSNLNLISLTLSLRHRLKSQTFSLSLSLSISISNPQIKSPKSLHQILKSHTNTLCLSLSNLYSPFTNFIRNLNSSSFQFSSVFNLYSLKALIFGLLTNCCEILKYSQVYKPYRSIVGQERGRTHRDLNERRKIKSNLNQINPNLV